MKFIQRFIQIIFAVLISGVSMAQEYQYSKNFNDDIYNIIPCQDKTFYTISVHPGCGYNSFSLRYLNEKGDVIWGRETQTFVGHLSVFEGVTDNTNSIILLFYTSGFNCIIKMDKYGELVFYRLLNPTGYKMNKIVKIRNSFYLSGKKNETDLAGEYGGVMVKLSENGELLWAKSYKKPGFEKLGFNDCIGRGDFLLVGGYSDEPKSYPFIGIMDTLGDFVELHEYVIDSMPLGLGFFDYEVSNLDFENDDIIYARFREPGGSYTYTMRMDSDLEMIWNKKIFSPGPIFCAASEGGVYMNSYDDNGSIARMDETGEIVSYYSSTLDELNYEKAKHMVRNYCGYLISTGQGEIGSSNDTYAHIPVDAGYCSGENGGAEITPGLSADVINRLIELDDIDRTFTSNSGTLTFTDTIGEMSTYCSATYVCSEASTISEEELGSKLLIYPNPTTEFIQLNIESGTPVSVYNLMGECVIDEVVQGGVLAVDHLTPGVYILQVKETIHRFVVR